MKNEKKLNVNTSMYQKWITCNQENFGLPGIEYFGKQMLFENIDKMIDVYARSFSSLRNKKDSSVTFCGPIIPSTIFAFYALNKLGIRANFVSHTLLMADAKEYIDNNNTETLIIFDKFYPLVASELAKTNIKNILFASLADDTPEHIKPLLGGNQSINNITNLPQNVDLITVDQFVENGSKNNNKIEAVYNKGETAVILYTGGSTGVPKGVEITNEGMAEMYKLCRDMEFDYVPGDRNLLLIPPNHPTSFVHCMVNPWLWGTTQVMQPIYDKNRFANDIKTLKPQYIMAAASHYATLPLNQFQEQEYSFMKWAFCGGEPVSYELAQSVNKVFERTGVQNPYLALAYGMSELGPMAIFSYKQPGLINKVGKPVPGVEARIVDAEGNILSNNTRGYLEIKTPCRMKGYFNKPELTKEFFNEDGFAKTGDVAKQDENGNFYDIYRASDSFIAPNGETIYLFDIENFIYKEESILEAEVTKLKIDSGNYIPVVHVVLKQEYLGKEAEIIARISEKCEKELGKFSIPKGYKIIESFGTNPVSQKRDYISLSFDRTNYYKYKDKKFFELSFPENSDIISNEIECYEIKNQKLNNNFEQESQKKLLK